MILRPKPTWERLGVGKSQFYDRYVYHEGGPTIVTGTVGVPRLKPIPISERIIGFLDAEVDAVIEAMRDERDAGKLAKRKGRDERGKFIAKQKEVEAV